jgi:hypothetical protein
VSGWDSPPSPDVNLGQVFNDTAIDIKVEELRNTITILDTRIQELLAQKGKPPKSTQWNESEDSMMRKEPVG